MKTHVVLFSGRFQPIHNGHQQVIEKLLSLYESDNVYIVTPSRVSSPNNPLTFTLKKEFIQQQLKDISFNPDNIISCASPYNPTEFFDQTNLLASQTILHIALGEKNKNRIAVNTIKQNGDMGYYVDELKRNAAGDYYTADKHGYITYLKKQDCEYLVHESPVSATTIRKKLSDKKIYLAEKQNYWHASTHLRHAYFYTFLQRMGFSYEISSGLISNTGMNKHVYNVWNDYNLSFKKLREIIHKTLYNEFSYIKEKTDGQNIFFSVIDDQIKFARNKGHISNFGKNALGFEDIQSFFSDTPESVQATFTEAFKAIEVNIKQVPLIDLFRIFENGRYWLNCEIINPVNYNIINYQRQLIVFHFMQEMNEDGNTVSINDERRELLYKILTTHNHNEYENWDIIDAPFVNIIPKDNVNDIEKMLNGLLDNLMEKYELDEYNNIGDYLTKKWIGKDINFKKLKVQGTSSSLLYTLINRFAFGDKITPINILFNKIDNIDHLTDAEKNHVKSKIKWVDDNRRLLNNSFLNPLEDIFVFLGVYISNCLDSYLVKDKAIALQHILQQLLKISLNNITDIQNNDIPEHKIIKIKLWLSKLNDNQYTSLITPSEGIVFRFDDSDTLYKLTGHFRYINQLLGFYRYSR